MGNRHAASPEKYFCSASAGSRWPSEKFQKTQKKRKKRSYGGQWHAPATPRCNPPGHFVSCTLIYWIWWHFQNSIVVSPDSFIPRIAGAAVTTITNPQNLTTLFITHDF